MAQAGMPKYDRGSIVSFGDGEPVIRRDRRVPRLLNGASTCLASSPNKDYVLPRYYFRPRPALGRFTSSILMNTALYGIICDRT